MSSKASLDSPPLQALSPCPKQSAGPSPRAYDRDVLAHIDALERSVSFRHTLQASNNMRLVFQTAQATKAEAVAVPETFEVTTCSSFWVLMFVPETRSVAQGTDATQEPHKRERQACGAAGATRTVLLEGLFLDKLCVQARGSQRAIAGQIW